MVCFGSAASSQPHRANGEEAHRQTKLILCKSPLPFLQNAPHIWSTLVMRVGNSSRSADVR